MGMKREARSALACVVCAGMLISLCGLVGATGIDRENVGIVAVANSPERVLGSLTNWSDIDKGNLGSPLYFDDVNTNGTHDPGEAYSATDPGGWTARSDNSCWLASGSNMLAQAGANGGNGQAIYNYYALNGITVGSSTLTWDEGGYQEYVINQWIADNPADAGTLSLTTQWASSTVQFTNYASAWEDYDPRQASKDAIAAGDQVGFGMWPVYADGSYGGGHALTVQDVSALVGGQGDFIVTDSDRDGDWEGPGDLNRYDDLAWGPIAFEGHGYYAWVNDFYVNAVGSDFYYPVGDVGYLAILSGQATVIPLPGSLGLLVIGLGGTALRRRKRSR